MVQCTQRGCNLKPLLDLCSRSPLITKPVLERDRMDGGVCRPSRMDVGVIAGHIQLDVGVIAGHG